MVFIAYVEALEEGASFGLFRTKQQAAEFGRDAVAQSGGRARLYKVDNRRVADARSAIPRGELFALEVITHIDLEKAEGIFVRAIFLPRYSPVRTA